MASQRHIEDKLIVWPPVLVIQNAGLGYNAAGKSIGLDNSEVRQIVETMVPQVEYRRVIALYNSSGHRGIALVLFPDTDVGYTNALTVHNVFKERNRGREGWQVYKPGDSKELYGFLADPDDMNRWDPYKKNIKKWRIESFRDKVLKPQQMRARESQKAEGDIAQAQQDLLNAQKSLEEEEKEVERTKMKVAEFDLELEAASRRFEELRKEHEQKLAERRQVFKHQRDDIQRKYELRNEEIREQVMKIQEENEREIMQLQHMEDILARDLDNQKKQEEKLEELRAIEHTRRMEMETRLGEIEERMQKQLEDVRNSYREKRMKLQQQFGEDVEQMFQEQKKKKEELERKIEDTNEQYQKTGCIKCLENFVPPMQRMLYSCGHASMCERCFPAAWKKSKKCPSCMKVQSRKPRAIPAVVYL